MPHPNKAGFTATLLYSQPTLALTPFSLLYRVLPNRIWLITLTVVVSSLKDGEAAERD
jgi:hypothetical protein